MRSRSRLDLLPGPLTYPAEANAKTSAGFVKWRSNPAAIDVKRETQQTFVCL